MKKTFILIIIAALSAGFAQAQTLNKDTLDKYSQKTEQAKIFNRIAADIHLDASQSLKFNQISMVYSDKAISIIKETKTARCDKMTMLKQVLKEYFGQIKQVLSPEQIAMLKEEREKYHFGRRFVTFNE